LLLINIKAMKQIYFLCLVLVSFFIACENSDKDISNSSKQVSNKEKAINEKPEYAMVIHGGAGTILKKNMTDAKYHEYYNALDTALMIGQDILANGGTSLEAIEKTIHYMEDSPLFNAGKGAVFTNQGQNELDASVMQGNGRKAGAIGGVTNVRNPISGAIAVMQKSEHVKEF